MSTEKPSPSRLAAFYSLNNGFLANEDLTKRVVKTIQEYGKELSTIIGDLRSDPGVVKSDIERLQFLQDLIELTENEWKILGVIVKTKTLPFLHEVGIEYYDKGKWPKLDESTLSRFQNSLFKNQPVSVLLGLIKSAKLEIDADIKDLVSEVLSSFVASRASLRDQQLAEHFQQCLRKGKTNCTEEKEEKEEERNDKTREFLKSIQRLCAIAVSPFDIMQLIGAKFTSAQFIAATPVNRFSALMLEQGMSSERGIAIHNSATAIEYRNEEAWISLLQAQQQVCIPLKTVAAPMKQSVTGNAKRLHNMTNMFHLEDQEMGEGYSIFSLSAYLVQLLRFLQTASCLPKALGEYEEGEKKELKSSLFEKLLARRPDLQKIELSYENDSVPVDYIDLANEVMESFVLYLDEPPKARMKKDATNAYNSSRGQASFNLPLKQLNTNLKVYKDKLSRQMHPLQIFPYIQSLESTRGLLSALGTSRREIFRYFRSEPRAAAKLLAPDDYRLYKDRRDVPAQAIQFLDRAEAAEILNLSHEDFLAITGESFWPSVGSQLFFQMPLASYIEKANPLFHIASFWGYKASDCSINKGIIAKGSTESQLAIEAMTDETTGIGLAFIKEQLLPRSGLNFEELLALLKTQYIGHRLVIVPMTQPGKDFEGHLSDMKLLASDVDQGHGKLTRAICEELHSFVRLRQKLGWDVATLDKSITCLKKNAIAAGLSSIYGKGIGPELLVQLGAIKELGEYLRVEVEELLPLWADLDTYGSTSKYARLFLHGDQQRIKAFSSRDGKFLVDNKPLADYERHLLSAFELVKEDLTALMDASKLTTKSRAALQSISAIFRLLLICKILEISYTDCGKFLGVMECSYDVFANPRTTLEALKAFKELISQGWSLENLALVLKQNDKSQTVTATEGPAAALNGISRGVSGIVREIQTSLAVAEFAPATTISDTVLNVATRIFGVAQGATVAQYINGKPMKLEDCALIATTINDCLLSDGGKLFKPQAYRDILLDDPNETEDSDLKNIDRATATQLYRQRTFLKLCAVEFGISSLRQGFIDKAREAFPDVDISILNSAVWSTTSNLRPDLNQDMASKAVMKDLIIRSTIRDGFKHCILPTPTTGMYTFFLSVKNLNSEGHDGEENPEPRLTINGVLTPTQKLDTTSYCFGPLPLQGGEEAVLAANFDLQKIEWAGQLGKKESFPVQLVISSAVSNKLQEISKELLGIVILAQKFNLDKQELDFFATNDSQSSLGIRSRDLRSLKALQTYAKLRESTNTKTSPLVGLLAWMERPDDDKSVYKHVASTLALPESLIKRLTRAKYDKLSDSEVIAQLRDIHQLASLQEIQGFCTKLGLRTDDTALQAFFGLAVSSKPFEMESDFDNTASLSALLQPILGKTRLAKYARQMQLGQRNALVSYLLQQKDVLDLGIWDADGLFEYFFIDVQMGPDLQTTRTKQAISTIQLYVQRCLLGLEQDSGALPEHVSRSQWEWMQKFSLWEANRKLALYPENWIDPTLRDNKTDLFQAFETALLANDLNMTSFTKGIRDYICSLHDISDLSVQAYLHDVYPPRPPQDASKEVKRVAMLTTTESYHFFAATKTSPYEYYYRRMDISPYFQHVFWLPWSKIGVDIIRLDADWDGTALDTTGVYLIPAIRGRRLYLFMPQMMLKTIPSKEHFKDKPPPQGDKVFSYKSMADQPADSSQPVKQWEIRLAWTELIDGQWLPKKTSTAALPVKADTISGLKNQLPSVANFHFYVKTQSKTDLEKDFLSIGVGFKHADSSYWYLGSFDLKEDTIAVSCPKTPSMAGSGQSAVDTKFNKYTAEYSTAKLEMSQGSKRHYGQTSLSPLLTLPEVSDSQLSQAKISWTLTYDGTENLDENYKLSGLVYDVQLPNSSLSSKFTYLVGGPQKDMTGEKLSKLGVNETFNFPTSLCLKRAITSSDSREGGLTARNAIANLSDTPENILVEVFGKRNGPYHELSSPYALYSWEICVHSIMLAMERLLATQQFELAIKVARLVFDPTAEGVTSDKCWRFPPFQELARQGRPSIKDILVNLENATTVGAIENGVGISEKLRSARSVAHAAARGQPVAYMKRIMMKYIEILVASGDEYFRQGTLEALPLAIQRYIEAIHVLGPDPPVKPNIGKRKIKTFQTLLDDMVDFELAFPFSCGMVLREDGDDQIISPDGFQCTLRTSYFSIPPNPELARLRAELKLRLYRIRNSLDIDGNPIKYAILEPSIDPRKLASLATTGGFSTAANILLEETNSPMPNYRFTYLLARAHDMCSELRSFGEQLLSAKEKKDTESLSVLRARQDTAIQNMTIALKNLHLEESKRTLESLQRTRQSHVTRLSFYLSLIGEKPDKIPEPGKEFNELAQTWEPVLGEDELRMTLSEKVEMDSADMAAKINLGASVIDLQASVLVALPNLTENIEPMGMGVSFKMDASNIAQGLGIVSHVKRLEASMLSDLGSRTAKKGQLLKQLQDRRLQANLAGHDIKNVDKQIEAQKKRIESVEKEIEQQLEMVKNAREVEEWYKNKFTNEQLYLWIENSVRTLYYDAYNLAMELAKRAERVMRFENGIPSGGLGMGAQQSFIRPEGYWDSARAGLLAGQSLILALKRMELAYQERRAHDFEVVKSVSLRTVDPLALVTLRETGSAEFSLPESLFDMDFPGHYMRRIKAVSVTIPCVVGPHTSVSATLTLVKHRYRVDATATTWSDYVKQRQAAEDADNKADNSGDGGAFRTDRVPLESIAVSSAQNDPGLFELDFHGERFLPFEGAGLLSSWRLDLPTAMRQFDYNTITNVVLQIRYTARNGGMSLRTAAEGSIKEMIKNVQMAGQLGALSTLWDLRGEWANEWHVFSKQLSSGSSPSQTSVLPKEASVALGDLASRLPYWTRGKSVKINKVTLVVSPARNDWKDKIKLSVCGNKKFTPSNIGEKATKLECGGLAAVLGVAEWKLSIDTSNNGGDKVKLERLLIFVSYTLE